jgi:hypothetical protein
LSAPGSGLEDLELAEHSSREAQSAPDRVAELERRIRILEDLDDATLGRFSGWDWWVCALGGLVAPIAALWWFAR